MFLAGLLLAIPWSAAAELEPRLRDLARPLAESRDLDPLLAAAASARVLLLGEATHGTREFYEWRALLTRRLIAEQGVRLVAIEGDWRPVLELNAYLRGNDGESAAEVARRLFSRWPQWMWGNVEFAELLSWMREWNRDRPPPDQVQLYGLDLYGHDRSLAAVEGFVRRHWPKRWRQVRHHYALLRRFGSDGSAYAAEIAAGAPTAESGVRAAVELLRQLHIAGSGIPADEWLAAEQDAAVVARAEAFYRAMSAPGEQGWNLRAEHLWLTAHRLLDHHGPAARLVVWAHNTHVGDARATAMAARGEINLGQRAREILGADAVFIVGFATYRGDVIAGRHWGGRRRNLPLPAARGDSWDAPCNALWREMAGCSSTTPSAATHCSGSRARNGRWESCISRKMTQPSTTPGRSCRSVLTRCCSSLTRTR